MLVILQMRHNSIHQLKSFPVLEIERTPHRYEPLDNARLSQIE